MIRTRWVVWMVLLVGAMGSVWAWRGCSEEARYTPEQLVRFALSSPLKDERYVIVEARVPAGYQSEFSSTPVYWKRGEREPTVDFDVVESGFRFSGACGPHERRPVVYERSREGVLKVCFHDKKYYNLYKAIPYGDSWLSCEITLSARRGESADETWSERQRNEWLDVCRSFRIIRPVPYERKYQPNIPSSFELPVYVDGVRKTAIVEATLPATYHFENGAALELRARELGRFDVPIAFSSQRAQPSGHAADPGQRGVEEICRVPRHPELTSQVVSHERTDDGGELAACSLRLDPKGDRRLAEVLELDPHGEQEAAVYLRKSLTVGESRLVCEVQLPEGGASGRNVSRRTTAQRADLLDVCRSFRLQEVREVQP